MSEDKKDIINEFIAPEDRKNWHKKPHHERARLWARAKKRCKAIPHDYRPKYFKGRTLKKDIQSTIGVVIIWIVLTALALSWGFIH
jgi:hypothetical protein